MPKEASVVLVGVTLSAALFLAWMSGGVVHAQEDVGRALRCSGGVGDHLVPYTCSASAGTDETETKFGALALGSYFGEFGLSYDMSTAEAARRSAVEDCGPNCSVATVFERCVALALMIDRRGGSNFGYAAAENIASARDDALRECRGQAGTRCEVRLSTCNDHEAEESVAGDHHALAITKEVGYTATGWVVNDRTPENAVREALSLCEQAAGAQCIVRSFRGENRCAVAIERGYGIAYGETSITAADTGTFIRFVSEVEGGFNGYTHRAYDSPFIRVTELPPGAPAFNIIGERVAKEEEYVLCNWNGKPVITSTYYHTQSDANGRGILRIVGPGWRGRDEQ